MLLLLDTRRPPLLLLRAIFHQEMPDVEEELEVEAAEEEDAKEEETREDHQEEDPSEDK